MEGLGLCWIDGPTAVDEPAERRALAARLVFLRPVARLNLALVFIATSLRDTLEQGK